MELKKYFIALNLIPQIGFKRSLKLIEHFKGDPENIFKIPGRSLAEIAGISNIPDYNPDAVLSKAEEEREYCCKNDIDITTIDDAEYPDILKHTPSPPIVLYSKGDISCLNNHCISVVGTRKPSPRGKHNAYLLVKDISKYGITVVSGFAYGIDIEAHKGAIDSGGKTCAVLGCGIDIDYPSGNAKYREKITENGCIISEFPIGPPPAKMNFPRRNRIIAGLSRACVMVEGSSDSGALITANLAFEIDRSVFAYPGYIDDIRYTGTNKLIKKNIASLITCHSDLINELSNILDIKMIEKGLKEELKEIPANLSDIEKKVFKVLDYLNEKHIDLIVNETNLAVNIVGQILLSLELKGLAIQKPGKLFLRS
jgi:DNA processing protein